MRWFDRAVVAVLVVVLLLMTVMLCRAGTLPVDGCWLTPGTPEGVGASRPLAVATIYDIRERPGNGDPAKRCDIVFLGEGYTLAEQSTFFALAEDFADALFTYEPFTRYAPVINVHYVGLVSNVSGLTTEPRDTALGAYFANGSFIAYDVWLAEQYGDQAPGNDSIIIMANTTTYGGSGFVDQCIFSAGNGTVMAGLMMHEFGHALGALADEYSSAGTWTGGPLPTYSNVSAFDGAYILANQHKWWRWWGEPSPHPALDVVGAYEGGFYHVFGVWRPTATSMMRQSGFPFNWPSVENLVWEMSGYAGVVEDATPWQTLRAGQSATVTTMMPCEITWRIDGNVVGQGSTLAVDELGLPAGLYTLTATVVDTTGWVRDEGLRAAYLTDVRSWPVDISGATDVVDRPSPAIDEFYDVRGRLVDWSAARRGVYYARDIKSGAVRKVVKNR